MQTEFHFSFILRKIAWISQMFYFLIVYSNTFIFLAKLVLRFKSLMNLLFCDEFPSWAPSFVFVGAWKQKITFSLCDRWYLTFFCTSQLFAFRLKIKSLYTFRVCLWFAILSKRELMASRNETQSNLAYIWTVLFQLVPKTEHLLLVNIVFITYAFHAMECSRICSLVIRFHFTLWQFTVWENIGLYFMLTSLECECVNGL